MSDFMAMISCAECRSLSTTASMASSTVAITTLCNFLSMAWVASLLDTPLAETRKIGFHDIADILEVVCGVHEVYEFARLLSGQRLLADTPQVGHDVAVQDIHVIINTGYCLERHAITRQYCRQDSLQHLDDACADVADFQPYPPKCKRRCIQQFLVEVSGLDDLRLDQWLVRNQPFHQAGKLARESDEDEGICHIESGVGIGDLARCVGGQARHAG